MFYIYALTADSAGANTFNKVLSVASTELAATSTRKGAQSFFISAASSQSAGIPPPDPFSSDFPSSFGTGAGGANNYILLTVNALRGTAGANVAARAITAFTPHAFIGSVSANQSSAATAQLLAGWIAAATSSILSALSFPRINHAIVSAKTTNQARQGRGFSRSFGLNTPSNSFSSEFTPEFGVGLGGFATNLLLTVGHVLGVTSPTIQAGSVVRRISKVALSAHDGSMAALRAPGRFLRATSAAVQSRVLVPGKVASTASPETLAIVHGRPFRLAAATAQAAHLGFGNLYFRGAAVVTAQATNLSRSLVAFRSGVSSNVASLFRAPARILRTASTETASTSKAVARTLSVLSPNVASLIRLIAILRGAVGPIVVAALATTTARFRSVGAVDTQSASILTTHARPILAAVASAQHAVLVRLNTLSHLLPLNAVSAQAIGMARSVSHAASVVSTAAQSCVRALGYLITASLAQVSAVVLPALHHVLALVAEAQSAFERGSQILVRGVASVQVAHVSSGGRIVTLTAGAFNATASAVRRSIAKLIGLASTQAAIVGRVDFKIIGVAMGNIASRLVPRGVAFGARQSQRSRVVSWFHLFVPDWAYQQTTLLPPSGGPAEPPSFGPIDPADQTTFAFDWSKRADFNDPIVSASVVSIPPGMTFLGPVFTGGTLVEVTALPFRPPQVPAVYSLRCTCVFASGRRSSFSIPVPICNL